MLWLLLTLYHPSFNLFVPFPTSRVASDCKIAELIYESLTAIGITVWFDKVNILPGRYWEQEFADGLLTSSCFVCLLSRNAINHPTKPVQNFNTLTSDSKADNVLMEWSLGTYVRAYLLHSWSSHTHSSTSLFSIFVQYSWNISGDSYSSPVAHWVVLVWLWYWYFILTSPSHRTVMMNLTSDPTTLQLTITIHSSHLFHHSLLSSIPSLTYPFAPITHSSFFSLFSSFSSSFLP